MTTKLSNEEVADLWQEYKQGLVEGHKDERLRNKLIETYYSLVRYNAERVWAKLPEGVDLNDLISAGVFGLMDAIDAFDLERGVKFETYCVPRIRGAMLDELRTMDWVPRLVRSKASKLQAARKQAEAEVGRPPTDAEIAAKMEMTPEEFDKHKADAMAVDALVKFQISAAVPCLLFMAMYRMDLGVALHLEAQVSVYAAATASFFLAMYVSRLVWKCG